MSIRIQSPHETIELCRYYMEKQLRGAYLRFGDGDVNLLKGRNASRQLAMESLQIEMQQTFELNGKGIMKSLPLHSKKYGRCHGMKEGVHEHTDEWADNILRQCFEYFIGSHIYSPVALAHLAIMDTPTALEFLRFLKSVNPLFIGNENIPHHIIKSLFGDTSHIPVPPEQSYNQIDEIERQTLRELNLRNKRYDVIVMAMGCPGRPLSKRILKNNDFNLFIFDFGSLLDALNGWETRTWIKVTNKGNIFKTILKDI